MTNKKNFNKSTEYSALLIFMVLFNPNAWLHNFVIFAFVYMTILHYLLKDNFKDKIVLTATIIAFILMTFTSDSFIGDNLELLSEKLSFVTIGAIILIGSVFRIKFLNGGK